jgi:hypothetical protein
MGLQVASIVDERARPELGFWVISDKDERRKTKVVAVDIII